MTAAHAFGNDKAIMMMTIPLQCVPLGVRGEKCVCDVTVA